MREDFILPACPKKNFAGALRNSDKWVTEVQCLPKWGAKKVLQWDKSPVSAAVCTTLSHCSPGNPARKAVERRVGGKWRSFSEVGFSAPPQSSRAGRVCSLQNFSGHQELKLQAGPLKSASRAVFGTLTLL